MVDLFKQAGIDPTDASRHDREKRRLREQGGRDKGGTSDPFGGHNLRQVIRAKGMDDDATVITRPRSRLASADVGEVTRQAERRGMDYAQAHSPRNEVDYEDDNDDGDDDGEDYDDYDYDEDEDTKLPGRGETPASSTAPGKPSPTTTPVPPQSTHTTVPNSTVPPTATIPLITVKPDLKLGCAAAELFNDSRFNLQRELGWQSAVAGDSSKIKSFRIEVTQQVDITPFGFMRPTSPFVQILHSIATYATRGGQADMHNGDYGFVGDRTSVRRPAAVTLDEKMWKWVSKTLGLDVPPLEGYYANPANAKLLYHDDASGGEQTCVPRMIHLPPPFLAFCLEEQRTPFELHQFVANYATRDGSTVTIQDCTLVMDWCFFAAHRAAKTTPTTSMLAITLSAAPADDDEFLRWLYKIDCTEGPRASSNRASVSPTQASQVGNAVTIVPPPQGATTAPSAPMGGPPPPDIWAQMATTISTSFAQAAAAMKPPPDPSDTVSERGGVEYDPFQMAIIQGFAHAPDITGVPVLWGLFQYTKNLETHKDNLRRRMVAWSSSAEREVQVPIERALYIPDSTMKEILSLTFNPGGILAEADAADLGLSLLICRARTLAAKMAIRKYERALEQSKRNRSMAEAQAEHAAHAAYDTGALPDNYHELLRCVGTYCALLHALFGSRCVFYRHCYALWTAMNSDLVYEQRDDFDVLYCRQIVWAVLMESRVYFSKQMSVEDFKYVHPDDIRFPKSNLLSIVQMVTDMTPIVRSSFPAAWYPAGTSTPLAQGVATNASVQGTSTVAPVQSVATMGTATPSVVSGITTGSTRAPRPPVTIRTNDVHPKVKLAMEAYIAKNKGVWLSAILTFVNLTIDDLPKLGADVGGTNSLCYNYILGHCKMEQCQHEHVHVRDITEEFVTELLSKLRPGITEFTANGVPPGTRRRRRSRRHTNA